PYAIAAASVVTGLLDDYARGWTEAYTDACQATALRHEQSSEMLDRRMACLESRRQEIGTLAGVLEHADARVAQRAATAVSDLAPIKGCNDAATLARQPPLPSDPRRRAELAALSSAVHQARAIQRFSSWKDRMRLLEPWLAVAPASGYQPAF